MKKLIFVLFALVMVLSACNRTDFVNKIVGTWKINKYLYATQDKTAAFDTTNNGYQLVIQQGYTFSESYKTFSFRKDSSIVADTVSYDTATMTYHIKFDTLRRVDTTITPYVGYGTWALLNSEEDLQLRDNGASDSSARIFNILKLTKGNLNLLNGNKEYDLTK